MVTLTDAIRKSAWAGALTASQIARVVGASSERTFAPQTMVCRAGEPVGQWMGVIDGLVKISTLAPDGRTSTLLGFTSGSWYGEGSLLRDAPRQYDVVALRRTRIAFVPRAAFAWLMDTSLPFNRFVAEQLNDRLSEFILRMEHERFSPGERYIAFCLAVLFDRRFDDGLMRRIDMSQSDIGYLVGRSRQSVSSALGRLEAEGLLQRGYNSLSIRDVARLRSYGAVLGAGPAA